MYQMRLQLPDDLRLAIERAAERAGTTPEAWAGEVIRRELGARDERLRSHFGAVRLGHATGADNEGIDADLARAYANGEG